jgi:HEAT repeat protein
MIQFSMRPAAVAIAALLAACGAIAPDAGDRAEEAKLLGVLRSDAAEFDKAKACRRLAVIGSKEAVPVLAGLLGHPSLGHCARFGLEPIPDPAVDDALRSSLGRLDGGLLVGAIDSIGARRDPKAVEPMGALLAHADVEVAAAAAAALGRIGTVEAAGALAKALKGAPAARRDGIAEGAIACAHALRMGGKATEAAALFDAVRTADVPGRLRIEARRGSILARGDAGIPLLLESLRGGGRPEFLMALGTLRDLGGSEATKALAAAAETLPPDRRPLFLQAIADRGGADVLAAVLGAARSARADVRRAAIAALGKVGDRSALPVLLEAAGGEDPEIAREAVGSLVALPGREADEAVLALLETARGKLRLAAIEIAGRRRMAAALPAIRKAAEEGDREVRLAALAALGEAMGAGDVPFLAARLAAVATEEESGAIIAALQAASRRAPDKDAGAGIVIEAEAKAPPGTRIRFLEALRAVGGEKAAGAVIAHTRDPEAPVREAAISILGRWMDESGPRALLAFVRGSDDPAERLAALRGWCDRVRSLRFSKEARLAQCREGLETARGAGEKRVAIEACRGIPAAETMDLILPYLADPALKEDAASALVGMSQRVIRFKPEAVVRAMRLVLEAISNEDLRTRAAQLLRNAGGKP